MSKMLERILAAQKKQQEEGQGSWNKDENVFFDFSEGTHRIRLVSEWVTTREHWIAPSKFSKKILFPETAFVGDDKLKKSIFCADFDSDTEMTVNEKTCVVCKLRAAANNILYGSGNSLDKEQRDFLTDVAKECSPMEHYYFLCIDRDNPEIAPGKKGFKIIEFPRALKNAFDEKCKSNPDIDCISDTDGVDFVVTKKKDGQKYSYTIDYVIKGRGIAITPLTEEEKNYQRPDIKKIKCKLPDQDQIFRNMYEEFSQLISDEGDVPAEASQGAARKTSPMKDSNLDEDYIPF